MAEASAPNIIRTPKTKSWDASVRFYRRKESFLKTRAWRCILSSPVSSSFPVV